ncbi:ribonuclease-like protein T2 [Ascodesmis nigricans]|uniref:Ribonuclease T2-like n=1 Tax=Ascodesmis nigricans TaxID=341454 RepID=A0A4V3SJU6_9PEZI|nr:ribonuclease-like protein T2 [Ascodesmis nigricans]
MFSLPLLLLGGLASTVSATPKACSITTLSCQNTTVVSDLCCFNHPGGQLLLTQFWDSEPATGPSNSWTIHGLWPDRCDGTYDSYCDSSREYTNLRSSLISAGENDLVDYMETYWKSNSGTDESFWKHEWDKHGTCISTLETSCYTSYTAREELIDYLHATVDLFKTRNTYNILSSAGITPSSSKTYTASAIKSALQAAHGKAVTIGCKSGVFNEVWYHYNVRGSVATGEFVPAAPDGTKDTCSGSVTYRPKSGGGSTPTTTTTNTTPAPTSTSVPSGSGYLNAVTSGSSKGCLISAGTWYVSGTCATYTAAASGAGFTLTSSKGKCGVTSGKFVCSSSTTAAVFTLVGGKLAYNGVSTWYGSAVPSGTTQIDVYTTSASGRTVALELAWSGN